MHCVYTPSYTQYLNGKYSKGFPMGAIKPIAVCCTYCWNKVSADCACFGHIRSECYIFIKAFSVIKRYVTIIVIWSLFAETDVGKFLSNMKQHSFIVSLFLNMSTEKWLQNESKTFENLFSYCQRMLSLREEHYSNIPAPMACEEFYDRKKGLTKRFIKDSIGKKGMPYDIVGKWAGLCYNIRICV